MDIDGIGHRDHHRVAHFELQILGDLALLHRLGEIAGQASITPQDEPVLAIGHREQASAIDIAWSTVMSRVSCSTPGSAKPPMKYAGRLLISFMITVTFAPFTLFVYASASSS